MKKSILSLLLALLLILGALLSSCADKASPIGVPKQTAEDEKQNDTENEKNPSKGKDLPPDGYLFAEDGALRFAYPSDWIEDVTSESLSFDHPTGYSFLTLETVDVSKDEFQTMTAEQYEERYGKSFAEEVGGTLFHTQAKHETNQNGLDVAFFSCFVTADGLTLKQLLYAVNIGDTSYRLVFLLEETSEEFEQTVFDSLKEITPAELDPNAPPRGFRFYTEGDLRFIYPARMDEETMSDPETGTKINLNIGYAATYFPEMNEILFDEIIGAEFEESGFEVQNLVIEKQTNPNGITINRMTYSLASEGYDRLMQQQIFAFTLNRTAYAIVLTLASSDDAPLGQRIFDSIENLDPEPQPRPEATYIYSHHNLDVEVPASFGIEYFTNQTYLYRGTSTIALTSQEKDDSIETVTIEDFKKDFVPDLEADFGSPLSNLSLNRFTTEGGLTVTVFSYTMEMYGMTFCHRLYFVTVDQTTHSILVMTTSSETLFELDGLISSSIRANNKPNYGENQ